MKVSGITQSAFEHLTNEIVFGKLEGGQRLNEIVLAEELGISRPPLREAFRRIENHRLAENIPRKGTFVTRISLGGLNEALSARRMVENHAIDVIIENNLNLAPLKETINTTTTIISSKTFNKATDIQEFHQTIPNFHTRLVDICNNGYMADCFKTLTLNLDRYRTLAYMANIEKKAIEASEIVEDHIAIIEMIETGEAQRAKDILANHFNVFIKLLKPLLKDYNKEGTD